MTRLRSGSADALEKRSLRAAAGGEIKRPAFVNLAAHPNLGLPLRGTQMTLTRSITTPVGPTQATLRQEIRNADVRRRVTARSWRPCLKSEGETAMPRSTPRELWLAAALSICTAGVALLPGYASAGRLADPPLR